jgi:hypothetical protein
MLVEAFMNYGLITNHVDTVLKGSVSGNENLRGEIFMNEHGIRALQTAHGICWIFAREMERAAEDANVSSHDVEEAADMLKAAVIHYHKLRRAGHELTQNDR